MRKIISRFVMLGVLLGCLGLATFGNFNKAKVDPPCPENCYGICAKEFDACKVSCGTNNRCVQECIGELNACNAYCDWVCS